MTKIIHTKSKYCLRYQTDFWNSFMAFQPKVHKALRYFYSLGKPIVWEPIRKKVLSYEIFNDITDMLYRPMFKKKKRRYSVFRNRVRVRFFFGGITNERLRTLGKPAWTTGRLANHASIVGEGYLFCYLFRINFYQNHFEVGYIKKFVEAGAFAINGKPVFNLFCRVHLSDILEPSSYEWYCFFLLYYCRLLFKKRWFRRRCVHIKSDFRLMRFLFFSKPIRRITRYAYGMNLVKALKYYKKPPKIC